MTYNFIIDSSCIILLIEIEEYEILLHLLCCGNKIILTNQVIEEINNKIDFLVKNIKKNGLIASDPDINLFNYLYNRYPNLGKGEISVLTIAIKRTYENSICILDDKKARYVAQKMNINHHGTLWLIDYLHKNKIIEKEKSINILEKIKNSIFWIDNKLVDDYIISILNS